MTGVPHANLTGMCWDGTTMYGVSTSLSQSQIFTINMTTGVCTPLGTPSGACAGAISLLGRIGTNYSLFSLDIVADNLYKWNKTTGVPTLVGPLGQNINFAQDGNVDPNDFTFYNMTYITGSELRKIDTSTGLLGPPLCAYTTQGVGIALIPVGGGGGGGGLQLALCRTGLNIAITDHGTIRDSVLYNSSTHCIVVDVNVRIDTVIHTWDSDLRFYIQKGNTGVRIINWVGGSGDNFIRTVLNDSASTIIDAGTAPFTGTFRPSAPLISFNGNIATGYWRLVVTDTANGDTGFLKSWCIVLSAIASGSCIGGIETVEIPNSYRLYQNYPNPFNPVTKIKYGLPENANVKLIIYDILGREISELVNEHKTANTYEVEFDASRLPSGVYFYKLETDNYTFTKKMLLIK
jgi:hypothetical protein